jgi:hypothetical protein
MKKKKKNKKKKEGEEEADIGLRVLLTNCLT